MHQPSAQTRAACVALPALGTALQRLVVGALLPLAFTAHATQTTVNFAGTVDFIGEYEYGTAGPLPPGAVPLLPLFQGATRVVGRYVYDPSAAVDQNPAPDSGRYDTPGSLSISLPELGLTFTSTGQLGFDVYAASPAHEFHVNGSGSFASTGNVGGGTLFELSIDFYHAPLTVDALPLGPVAWQYANVHIDLGSVTPPRDLFIGLAPVPEPNAAWLLLAGLGAVALRGTTAGRRRQAIEESFHV